ncbi:hypothetical protein N9N67_02475 [Bacteriovoracaceae bacterium]|nr:hypothetical protein [Bacteriovoracaceae bacterium]
MSVSLLFIFLVAITSYSFGESEKYSYFHSKADGTELMTFEHIKTESHMDAINYFESKCFNDPYFYRSFHSISNLNIQGVILFPKRGEIDMEELRNENPENLFFSYKDLPLNSFQNAYQVICYQDKNGMGTINRIMYHLEDGTVIYNEIKGLTHYTIKITGLAPASSNSIIAPLQKKEIPQLIKPTPIYKSISTITGIVTYQSPYRCFSTTPSDAKYIYFKKRVTIEYTSTLPLVEQIPSFRAPVCQTAIGGKRELYLPHKFKLIESKLRFGR